MTSEGRGTIMLMAIVALAAFAATQKPTPVPQSDQFQHHIVGSQTNQQADGAAQTDQDRSNGKQDGDSAPSRSSEHSAAGAPQPCDADCQRRAEERSEYWIIAGHRIKITDFFLAIFTALLVLVGGIQSYLLNVTVRDTGRTAQAAIDTATATKLNADAFVANALPFISLTGFFWGKRAQSDAVIPGMQHVAMTKIVHVLENESFLAFGFKNLGQGTAVITEFSLGHLVGDLPEQPSYEKKMIAYAAGHDQEPIFINHEQPLAVTTEDKASVEGGEKLLWAFGMLAFRDILGEVTELGFAAKWNPSAQGEGKGDFEWQHPKNYDYNRKRKKSAQA